jgi:hypothetical protein
MWSVLCTTCSATALRQLQRHLHSRQQQRPLQPLQHLPNHFLCNQLQLRHLLIRNWQLHLQQYQSHSQRL